MRRKTTFDVLLLLARPAAGKSEIIHYLENTPAMARKKRFHIGRLVEIDDFPMLWTWFEEDDLLEKWGIHACTRMLMAIFSNAISGICSLSG